MVSNTGPASVHLRIRHPIFVLTVRSRPGSQAACQQSGIINTPPNRPPHLCSHGLCYRPSSCTPPTQPRHLPSHSLERTWEQCTFESTTPSSVSHFVTSLIPKRPINSLVLIHCRATARMHKRNAGWPPHLRSHGSAPAQNIRTFQASRPGYSIFGLMVFGTSLICCNLILSVRLSVTLVWNFSLLDLLRVSRTFLEKQDISCTERDGEE